VRVAETVGARIRAARQRKGFSQVELGRLLGHTVRQRMNDIEMGRRTATTDEITRLAALLDVPSDYLLGLRVLPRESIVVERVQDSDRRSSDTCPPPRTSRQVSEISPRKSDT
jgi:transcriptional regulator with XRE-family HTH domain